MSDICRLTVNYFNLGKICGSGQVFRMYEREPGLFDLYSGERHVRVFAEECTESLEENKSGAAAPQHGQRLTLYCSEAELGYWRRYLDIDRDYEAIVKMADERDKYLCNARDYGCSIRILHQDIWEMMISFIISQQKQIPSIRKCIEGLSAKLGQPRREVIRYGESGKPGHPEIKEEVHEWFAFPSAKEIAEAGPRGVEGLSLGYRERYIYETSRQFLERGIEDEVLEAMSCEEAKKYLLSFTGIGEKVANCILLFGAGFVDAFPIDTHIKDILYREYYLPGAQASPTAQEKLTMSDYERLTKEHFDRYRGYRGIVQQWIFAAEIVKK